MSGRNRSRAGEPFGGRADDYYEDDPGGEKDGAWGEEPRAGLRQRVLAVFGTSYGVSLVAHGGLLLVLMTIAIAVPAREEVRTLAIKPPRPRPQPRDDAKLAEETHIEVPVPEADEPVVDLLDEPPTPEPPKGEPDHASNKRLDAHAFVDTFGVGPGESAGRYGRRDGMGRASRFGGSPETVRRTEEGLRWLAAHQSPDGRWDSDGWTANCSRGPTCAGPGDNLGAPNVDVGLTSLALLAFMGQGNTPRFGPFKRVVRRGMRWLRRQQRADGSVGFVEGGHAGAYQQATATMALAEAYGLTRLPSLWRPAERAVAFVLAARNPGLGWRYGVRDGRNDTSVTGWMVLALKAARVAGLEVPDEAFAGALAWIDRATSSDGAVGYMTPGGGSSVLGGNEGRFEEQPTLTAVGVLCRLFAGQRPAEDRLRRGVRLLAQRPPAWGERTVNFYYWYYGTYAMFHFGDDRKWASWNAAMRQAIEPHQRERGCERGSWDPVGEWCKSGGRVYATAMNVLTLEIYYRYRRAHGKGLAAKPGGARQHQVADAGSARRSRRR
ncbi:MAG: hypothetical protein D6731_11225 [Planctomycetota bacterium]|nr:MAG: hypothetical protein D6731_11225 [Planctomycetota bacterium]